DSDTYRPDYPDNNLIRSASDPAVAADAEGNFVVTWTAVFVNNPYDQYADDPDRTVRILARVYGPRGRPLTPQPIVHEESGNFHQIQSSVALDDQGNFVVAWTSQYFEHEWDPYPTETDVFYKQLTWDRKPGEIVPLTDKLSAPVFTDGIQEHPSVASTA